jgi:hypothetical protein
LSNNLAASSHTYIHQEKERRELVSEGIDIILALFVAVDQQRIFPRTIMTKKTRGQIIVHNKEQILYHFEMAGYQNCRINAYPAFVSEAEERDYKRGINLDLLAPNILFIDLDTKGKSDREFQHELKQILKNIAKVLHGAKPLVISSGHGHHIIIPVNAKEAIENFKDFEPYTNEPSQAFLQFAERCLSFNKSDPSNNPGFKSCLLRVPYTFNSRCIDEGFDPEVKVVQQWDNSQSLPDIDNLLGEFQTLLIDQKLKAEIKEKDNKNRFKQHSHTNMTNTIPYVEKLLDMPIADYRKNAISLILTPYFVNIQHQSNIEAFGRIKEWVSKCDKIRHNY